MKKKLEYPHSQGLKHLVPNYYFEFSCRSSWGYGKVPLWGGGGAQQLQCKSESAQCPEKQQSPCEGVGGA